jgi:membrane protein
MVHVPGYPIVANFLDFIFTLAVVTALFAMIFELLPECRIAWRDVWLGAAVSALLFVAGQLLLGWYIGRFALSSAYGGAGGLVVFLLWTNYSAQIMLLGAEFTHAYATRFGSLRELARMDVLGPKTHPE